MRIAVDFRPFVLYHIIYVYDDDKVIDCARVLESEIVDNVAFLRKKYGANEVVLYGNKNMLSKYQEGLSLLFYNKIDVRIEER